MPLTDDDRQVIATELIELTRFDAHLDPERNNEEERTRYLRYRHELSHEAWKSVVAYLEVHRTEIEGAEVDGRTGRFAGGDHPHFSASLVADRWRLLFAYAAQFTPHAGLEAEGYLRRTHNLGEEEWSRVWALLTKGEGTEAGPSADSDGEPAGAH